MKQQLIYKVIITLFFLSSTSNAQKQIKTFNENFNVSDNAVLNINTTHTDIEFETWNKNQIAIEVTLEIEGASSKEIAAYFKQNEIKISGNSKQIDITTGVENTWFFKHATGGFTNSWNNDTFVIPEITAIPELDFLDFVIDSIQMPPVPPMPVPEFDYEAFQKEGDAYLKKWQKQFDENFGEDFEKKMEAWQIKAEQASKAHQKSRTKQSEIANKQRIVAYEKARIDRLEAQNDRKTLMEERQLALREHLKENAEERRLQFLIRRGDTISSDSLRNFYSTSPNVYYFNSASKGKSDKVKVKKHIKIKMPKSATIKMNVRHGEVKLAENTNNMNAKLSYSDLFALTIDGDKTEIDASYSPVNVQNWNYGKLNVNYSDHVDLKQVKTIALNSNSSEVTIEHLLKNISVENNFGALTINQVSKDFTTIDVTMKNGELHCKLPSTPFAIQVNGENSKFEAPSSLKLTKTKNFNTVVYKGYNQYKNAAKSIVIASKYSDVVLD